MGDTWAATCTSDEHPGTTFGGFDSYQDAAEFMRDNYPSCSFTIQTEEETA